MARLSLGPSFSPRATQARKHLFAQITPRRHLQERLDRRARQRDGIFACVAAFRRRRGGRSALPIRQAIEIGFVEDQSESILVREHVLRELRAERASLSPIAASRDFTFGDCPAPARRNVT